MAQLKDDCFAFGDTLIPFEQAISALTSRVECVVDQEEVPLRSAVGRVLAENIVAPRNVPPHNNSAVDGYAVFDEDMPTSQPVTLPVGGRVAAGHPLGHKPTRGEAVRIFTGAPMPDGMDTVYMEEDCLVVGEKIELPVGLKAGSNRRFAGEDVKAGDTIVTAGKRLRPQEIGLIASVGRQSVKVLKPIRAAVFSTGDEVRDPSTDAPAGCIFDANRYAIMSALTDLGVLVTDLGILPDDPVAITDALSTAAPGHEILLTSGGVSAGEEDHVKSAVESLGSVHFWRLAIKPGRPIALGQVGQTAFVGLPGNPVAAMVTFLMIAQPVIRLLGGEQGYAPSRFRVPIDFDYKKKTGRREWVRVCYLTEKDGSAKLVKHHLSGAGILTSMVAADGLAEMPEEIERLEKGALVDYLPFKGLLVG